MKNLLIRKYADYVLRLDRQFNLIFIDLISGKMNQEPISFPVVLQENLELYIPEDNYHLKDFLNNRIEYIEGKDVEDFLKIIKVDLIPFFLLLMKANKIDIFFNKTSLFVLDLKTDNYIIFNDKNMSIQVLDKIYRNQIMFKEAQFNACKEELYMYVRHKIQNGVGHNDFVNLEIKGYKHTEGEMEKEFLKSSQNFDIKRSLFLYESLIRLKEDYLNEDHSLISESELQEIYNIIDKIKELIAKPISYEICKEEE